MRRKSGVKNRVAPEMEAAVVPFATEQPGEGGQVRVANDLAPGWDVDLAVWGAWCMAAP